MDIKFFAHKKEQEQKDQHKKLAEHCEKAAKIVKTWPEWKQNLLGK